MKCGARQLRYTAVMSTAPKLPPPGFDELCPEEQLDYVNALWGRVITGTQPLPIPEWQRKIISERLAEYRAGESGPGRSWAEIRSDLEAELDNARR